MDAIVMYSLLKNEEGPESRIEREQRTGLGVLQLPRFTTQLFKTGKVVKPFELCNSNYALDMIDVSDAERKDVHIEGG